jgi:hypothetical protein
MDNYQEMQYLNHLWTGGHAPWKIWTDKRRDTTGADPTKQPSSGKSR